MPCGRCVKFRINCTRETVRLRNLSTKHADEITFLESLRDEIVASGTRLDSAIIRKIDDRIAHLQFGNSDFASVDLGNRSSTSVDEQLISQRNTSRANQAVPSETKETDASILTALEYMAWGRSFAGCYPHFACACHHRRALDVSTGGSESRSLDKLTSSLPRICDARRLVQFHIRHLVWHHNCLHSSTFWEQCEEFWQNGRYDHPQWLASYLAVLSVSLT